MTFGLDFAVHAELAKLWRRSDLIYARRLTIAPFNNDACVNNFPSRRHNGQWKPGNTAHTCIDHNGNDVRRKFFFLRRHSVNNTTVI